MVFRRRSTTTADKALSKAKPNLIPPIRVDSRLLANVLEGVSERSDRLTVLDLGAGAAGTVQFFSELDCPTRLIFADCESLALELAEAAATETPPAFTDSVAHASKHIGLSPNQSLDLVLLWDYLHYFDLNSIEILSSALQPHIHRHTRGYGFGTLHSDQGIPPNNYAIASDTEIFMQPTHEQALPFGHSQQALGDNFLCLRISRGTLLQEGHLELLLEP